MKMKTLDFPIEIKSEDITPEGVFSGYGSVFGEIDAYSEVVAKGAFKKSLKTKVPAMLWQHKSDEPIGVWTSIQEDNRGLAVEGKLAMKTESGADAYELLKMGAVKGLSIGYMPIKYKVDVETEILTHTELDLWEVSLVTFPALPSAQVDSVKSFFADGIMPSERECEEFLRDAGLSRNQAKTFLSKGYRACLRDADKDETKAVGDIADKVKALLEMMKNGKSSRNS